jgi:hypothetical protein
MRAVSALAVVALVPCARAVVDSGSEPAERATQCMRDDDCALLPSALTCCLECPPAPPFEAAPAWILDGILIENETTCATRRWCPEVECGALPAGCEAHAACEEGRCVAVATRCGIPTS